MDVVGRAEQEPEPSKYSGPPYASVMLKEGLLWRFRKTVGGPRFRGDDVASYLTAQDRKSGNGIFNQHTAQ